MEEEKEEEIKECFDENDINLTEDLFSDNESESKFYPKDIFIYSWGKNKYGELGLNSAIDKLIPSPIKTMKLEIIKSIKVGGRATIIMKNDNQILICGSNIFNLLAKNKKTQNNEQYQKTFKALKFFEDKKEIIKDISIAEFHSLALTNNGEIYGWGGNLFNKLSHNNGLCLAPSKIFIKRKIISIACGDYHSCALSENGSVYPWGGGGESYNKGQCGHGTKKDVDNPKKVEFFANKGVHITKIACGGYHTIVKDENNQLYGFGKGIFGQCGYGKSENTSIPKEINFSDKNLESISDFKCGGEHTMFLSNTGKVYVCGHGYFGQLGLGNNKNIKSPLLVNSLSNKNIIEIQAGWSHSLVLTDDGFVYSSGCGKFGELGLGDTLNKYNYSLIRKLRYLNVNHIFAGGHHSWCTINDTSPVRAKFVEPEPLEKPNFKMSRKRISGLSFEEKEKNQRSKTSNTIDYKQKRNLIESEDNFGHQKNNSFEKNTVNNIKVIYNEELKKMIDDYNDEKNKSINNIDNLIDCFDNINNKEIFNKKIKNKESIPKLKEDKFEKNEDNYIINNINEQNKDLLVNEKDDESNKSDIINKKDEDENSSKEDNMNKKDKNEELMNIIKKYKSNNSEQDIDKIQNESNNLNCSNYSNVQNKNNEEVIDDNISNNKYNESMFYIKKTNLNRIMLQLVYSELKLSHRFIRFEINHTNKNYKLDYNTLNNMIKRYLSLDKGNVKFHLQYDNEVVKRENDYINPMMESLINDIKDKEWIEKKKCKSYTIAICYDYTKNKDIKKLYEKMKMNYNYNTRNINYVNFKIIDENQILNDDKSLERILSNWIFEFYEQFKELFSYYDEDNENNFENNDEKFMRPRFLEIRPKFFI